MSECLLLFRESVNITALFHAYASMLIDKDTHGSHGRSGWILPSERFLFCLQNEAEEQNSRKISGEEVGQYADIQKKSCVPDMKNQLLWMINSK